MNRRSILLSVFGLVPKESIRSVFWYGNFHGRDVDLLVVLKGNSPYRLLAKDVLDIIVLGEDWLKYMISHLDPTTSEPILTGIEIYGTQRRRYLRALSIARANRRTTIYLIRCASLFLDTAKKAIAGREWKAGLATLSFSASYLCFAEYYVEGAKVTSFEKILSKPGSKLLRQVRKLSKRKRRPSMREMERVFLKTRTLLTRSFEYAK